MSGRLGELLVRENLISLQQLQKAQEEQRKTGGRIGYQLTKLGFINERPECVYGARHTSGDRAGREGLTWRCHRLHSALGSQIRHGPILVRDGRPVPP